MLLWWIAFQLFEASTPEYLLQAIPSISFPADSNEQVERKRDQQTIPFLISAFGMIQFSQETVFQVHLSEVPLGVLHCRNRAMAIKVSKHTKKRVFDTRTCSSCCFNLSLSLLRIDTVLALAAVLGSRSARHVSNPGFSPAFCRARASVTTVCKMSMFSRALYRTYRSSQAVYIQNIQHL